MAEPLARGMQVSCNDVAREKSVSNLKLGLIGTPALVGLILSIGCGREAPGTAETPATTAGTPATDAPSPATPGQTPAVLGADPGTLPEAGPTAEFHKAIAAYVVVHQKADSQVPSLKRTDDAKEISSREVALGDAIRTIRAGARPGDVMRPEIAEEFRRVIKSDYLGRDPKERKFFLEEIPTFRPVINQAYPSTSPLATFPATLLEVMPKLPEILEYRLLREGLSLRDVKANIIVDYIPDVF
jgi:hypothetical protein